MAAPGSQQGQEMSRNYILGSSLRGAIIGRFLKNHQDVILDESPVFRDEFLTGTRFFNAYLTLNDEKAIERITFPAPNCFFANKEDVRRAGKGPYTVKNALYEEKVEGEVSGRDSFVYLDKENIYEAKVEMTANLHIQRTRNIDDSQMYRYEAIAKGQMFTGFIQCEEKYEPDFLDTLAPGELYIGGSKGSGYGKCRIIENPEALSQEEYEKQFHFPHLENQGSLIIYAMSDLILYDELGRVSNNISEKYLAKVLGVDKVILENKIVTATTTSGYNHKHRAHAVQQTAVRAGSLFCYQYTGELKKEAIFQLEEEGVGLRREEGYGRIAVQLDLHQKYFHKGDNEQKRFTSREFQKTDEEDIVLLEKIESNILKQRRYDDIVYSVAPKMAGFIEKNSGWTLSSAQTQQLLDILNGIYKMKFVKATSEAQNKLARYLKKHNKTDGLKTTKVEAGYSLYSMLEDMSNEKSTHVLELQKAVQERVVFNIEYEIKTETNEEFYDKCLFLIALAYYFKRGGEADDAVK